MSQGLVVGVIRSQERRLHAGHFAFMRAVVQGVEARQAWARYLAAEEASGGAASVVSTMRWIRERFALAARKEHRFGTARLLSLEVQRIPQPKEALPSLEAFAEEEGLEDFSQREQIEAYEARYGTRQRRAQRRQRIVDRQLQALAWLEQLVLQAPRAGDSVVCWFTDQTALRLEAAELFTLAKLVERINGVGRNWHAGIPGIGAAKAQRVVNWLAFHATSTGLSVGEHVRRQRTELFRHELQRVVAPAADIRPLEKLLVPQDLDGSTGVYRRPQAHCLLSATNDYQAIIAWIQSKQGVTPDQRAAAQARRRNRDLGVDGPLAWMQVLSHTQRAYRKEAERFLMWAVVQKGKPLSSMTTEDCVEYRQFLADPQPRSRWCGPRNRERWSPLWRPFEGPLDPGAQRQAVTVLRNLYAFWADKNYVMGNPWSGVSVPRSAQPKVNAGRSLTQAQWRFVGEQADLLPERSSTSRLRFALSFLYATGLRLSEAVAARVDHLEWVEFPPDMDDQEPSDGWLLNVVGKGSKLRQVPVPMDVVAHLTRYLSERGLDPDPEAASNVGVYILGKATDLAETAPALARDQHVDARQGLASNTLYDQLKRFFTDCSEVLSRRGDQKGAARLARASTHWLRHTHASHAIAKGMDLKVEQEILGHASLSTTTIYVTTETKRKLQAIERFWRK